MPPDNHDPDVIVRIASTSGTTGQWKFIGDTRRSLWHIVRGVEHILDHDTARYRFVSVYRFNQRRTYTDTWLAFEHGMPVLFCTGDEFLTAIRRFPTCHTFLMTGDAARFASAAPPIPGPVDTCSLRVSVERFLRRLAAASKAT